MDMLRVWINDTPVGRLARNGRGATFAYDDGVTPENAVSLSMPIRVKSYDTRTGMLPIFDTNLPEGALRESIMKALSKASSARIDEVDVLTITGGNQIGRIRILPDGQKPERRQAIGKIEDILDRETTRALISEVMERYALRSGVSGAMPKVLLDDIIHEEETGHRSTVQTGDFILKFDAVDYPGLSMNEFHSLEVAKAAGLEVAEAQLSRDGRMLAVRRFDEIGDQRVGFEDFASLNALTASEKYTGTIERHLFKAMEQFSGRDEVRDNMEALYRMIVLNVGLRNGDAHLKNFAVLYESASNSPVRLAPAYDVVTTRAWIENDMMALTYGGTTRWPNPKQLHQMGARAKLTQARATEIMTEVGEAIQQQIPVMAADIMARGMPDLAERMTRFWNEGLRDSLGMDEVVLEVDEPLPSFT